MEQNVEVKVGQAFYVMKMSADFAHKFKLFQESTSKKDKKWVGASLKSRRHALLN